MEKILSPYIIPGVSSLYCALVNAQGPFEVIRLISMGFMWQVGLFSLALFQKEVLALNLCGIKTKPM